MKLGCIVVAAQWGAVMKASASEQLSG